MKRLATLLVALLFATNALGAPSISAISGTSGTGNSLVISGSGFGSKSRSKPWVWADFQDGDTNPNASLSHRTTWNQVQERALDTSSAKRWGNGTSVSASAWGTGGSNTTAFRTDLTHLVHGNKIVISLWRRSTVDFYPDVSHIATVDGPAENFKILRGWASGAGTYPNMWTGIGRDENPGAWRWSNERMTAVTGETRVTLGSSYAPTTTWRLERYFFRYNSTPGSLDGAFHIYLNNSLLRSDTTVRFDSAGEPGVPRYWYIQNNSSNYSVATGEEEWFDSIYVDDSWNTVYIGNAATLAATTQLEVQPYTAWSASQITIEQRTGTLTGPMYLYVCDENLTCNSAGFPLAASSSALPPSIDSISPSNGPAEGGTTVTLTGSDLVSGAQVTIGGIAATDEDVDSSTSMTFVTPAGTASTNVDVVVQNPDLQIGTLSLGWSYDAAPGLVDVREEAFDWIEGN